MNVLSLFDGISCGRLALARAGISVNKYFASEIDKYAIKISEANYPGIIRLGDVLSHETWDFDWSSIDLVLAGFPCQSWSVAGKQLGDRDPRGGLFWTMLDIAKKVLDNNPNARFLFENVRMKKDFEEYITQHTQKALGTVHKILINSALVSAQNRQRFYWTNFETTQPEDLGIVLADIIEAGVVDREKSYCIDASYSKAGDLDSYLNRRRRQLVFGEAELKKGKTIEDEGYIANAVDTYDYELAKRCYGANGKSPTVTTGQGGGRELKVVCGAIRGRYKVDGVRQDHKQSVAGRAKQTLEVRADDKSNALTTVQKDNVLAQQSGGFVAYRKLSPLECERLQTLPDNYTNHVSNTQRYKAIGNGWTVDVIAHILRSLKWKKN